MNPISSKIKNQITNQKAWFAIMAFVFSFLMGQEIFYVFRTSSVYVNIQIIWSALCILICLVLDFRKVISCFCKIGFLLYFFLFIILVSFINSWHYAASNAEFLISLKGAAFFGLNACLTIFTVMLFGDQKEVMVKGMFFGLIVNFIEILLVRVSYSLFNYVLTFSDLFPQISFYIPRGGQIQAQGFFKEPSHLTDFVIISNFLIFSLDKSKARRTATFLMTLIILLLAGSGNVIIFALGLVALLLFNIKKVITSIKEISKNKKTLIVFSLVCVFLVLVAIVLFAVPTTRRLINLALTSLNPADSGNSERLSHMIAGLNIAIKYPLGVGFGLSSTMMGRFYPDFAIKYTYNVFLSMMIDLGWFGGFIYLLLFLVPAWRCLSPKSKTINVFLGVCLLASATLQFINGDSFPIEFFPLGLVYYDFSQNFQSSKSSTDFAVRKI